jgi:hypothetical protein
MTPRRLGAIIVVGAALIGVSVYTLARPGTPSLSILAVGTSRYLPRQFSTQRRVKVPIRLDSRFTVSLRAGGGDRVVTVALTIAPQPGAGWGPVVVRLNTRRLRKQVRVGHNRLVSVSWALPGPVMFAVPERVTATVADPKHRETRTRQYRVIFTLQ